MDSPQSANTYRPIDRFLLRILYDQDLRLKLEYGCSDEERLNKFVELGRMANFDIRPKDLLNKFGVKSEDDNAGHLVVSGRGTEELTVEWRTPEGASLPTAIHLQKTTLVEDSFHRAAQVPEPGFDRREALFATVWLTAYADERISPPELDEIQAAGLALFGSGDFEEIENRLYDLLHSEGPEGIAKRILHVAAKADRRFRMALFRAAVRVVKSDEKIVVPENKFLKALGTALEVIAVDDEDDFDSQPNIVDYEDYIHDYIQLADNLYFYALNFADGLMHGRKLSEAVSMGAAFFLVAGELALFAPEATEVLRSWSQFTDDGPNIETTDIEALRNIFRNEGYVGLALVCESGIDYSENVLANTLIGGMLYSRRYSDRLFNAFHTLIFGTSGFLFFPEFPLDPDEVDKIAAWAEKYHPQTGQKLMGTLIVPSLPRYKSETTDLPAIDEKFVFIAAAMGLVVCAFQFSNVALWEISTKSSILNAAARVVPEFKRQQAGESVLELVKQTIQSFGLKRAAKIFYRYLATLCEQAPNLANTIHKVFVAMWQAGLADPVCAEKNLNAKDVYLKLFDYLDAKAPDNDNGALPSQFSNDLLLPVGDANELKTRRTFASQLHYPTADDDENVDTDDETLEPIDALTNFFNRRNWMIKVDYDDPGVHTTYAGNNGQFNCFAKLRLEQSQLVFYSIFPIRTPKDKRMLMAELITRANFGMVIGNFELDFNDGEVRYKSSLDFEGVGLLDKMLENLIHANILTMDRYLSGLYALIYSDRTPLEIIEDIESGSRH